MLKIFGLIRTLGWKHFLWKVWLLGKKKAGVESWFSKSIPYDQPQRDGISVGDFLSIITGDGYWSEQHREHITGTLRSLNLPIDHYRDLVQDILSNKITYFSHVPIALSGLDFNYNPIEDIHVPAGKHSSRYFSFDPAIGDLKKVWELNRFHWANPLVTAYILEGSEDRRKEIRDYYENALVAWLAQCPHERSVAWACSQEISIRCLNWLWAIWLLEIKNESVLTPLLNAIQLSAAHVFRQIDFARAQRNNHAITESAFLLFFSRFFPQQPESAKYRSKGEEVLTECLEDQFFDDGGYIQNSHTYHRFALQSLCVVFPIIEDKKLKELLRLTMEASYRYLRLIVANENGEFPNFGPNDGAMLFNFGGCDYRDLRPILNSLFFILYNKFIYNLSTTWIDTFITQSTAAKRPVIYERSADAVAETGYYTFADAGIVCMQQKAFKVYLRCADMTKYFRSACDQLHVDLWYKGKNILIDTGTWEYFSRKNPEHFSLLLSTSAHNTVMVSGKEQMKKGPRFTFLTKANGKFTNIDPEHWEIEGCHDGFTHSVSPKTIHSRKVKFNQNGLLITDTILKPAGEVIVFWHLGETPLANSDNKSILLKKSGLKISFNSEVPFNIIFDSFPRSLYYASATLSPIIRVVLSSTGDYLNIETMIEEIEE